MRYLNRSLLLFSALATILNFISYKPVLAQNCDPNDVNQTCVFDWVDKEIKLEVDVSGSITDNEYTSQLQSYAAAFQNEGLQRLIASNSQGIAVSLGFWAGTQQRPIANLDLLSSTPSTSIVNPSVFGANSAIGSEWFILRYNGRNDPALNNPTDSATNPAAAFAAIINYFSNPNYRTDFLSGLGTATNPAGAIRSANEGYDTGDTNSCNGIDAPIGYCASGFKNNSTGDPFANNLGTIDNPYIRSSYERIIDISTDGIQNTDIDGGSPQSGDALFGNGNQSNCIEVTLCQDAILLAQNNFSNGADNRGNGINAIGITADVDQTLFNFSGTQNITDYLRTGALVPENTGVPPSDPNYQSFADTTLGPLIDSNSPNSTAIAIEANCFDQAPVNGCMAGETPFTTALTNKLTQELEAVPFEFKPGYGLLIGVGIFSFRHWQLNKKKRKNEKKTNC